MGCNCSNDISQWISASRPKNCDAWYLADHLSPAWEVYLEKGSVYVKPYNRNQDIVGDKPDFVIPDIPFEVWGIGAQKYTYKVTDGWLIGFNKGEWGGGLYWFSNTGKENYEISDDQIRGFIKREGELYAIEGLSHLSTSEGRVRKIIKNDKTGKYKSITYLKLSEAPEVVTLDSDNSMIVVTESGLIRVITKGKVIRIMDKLSWWDSSNSIVIDSTHNAYLGMRQGVARVSLAKPTPATEWLVPSKSFLKIP